MPHMDRDLAETTVLLVEDDAFARLTLAETFRDIGLTVVEASSGDEAWTYIEAGGKFDLLFTDLRMPGKIDGRDLVKLITRKFHDIHVIVASGNPGPSLGVEFKYFLLKPFSAEVAAGLVLTLLKRDSRGTPGNPPNTTGHF